MNGNLHVETEPLTDKQILFLSGEFDMTNKAIIKRAVPLLLGQKLEDWLATEFDKIEADHKKRSTPLEHYNAKISALSKRYDKLLAELGLS